MKITINGEAKTINSEHSQITIDSLIQELGHHPKLIVVEYNGTIIEPKEWETQGLKEGDNLEIVTIVGGGSNIQ
tara:strand:- start:100 stop:321 length:222 start_codon:yes stop_codon:yes gene_type:complete